MDQRVYFSKLLHYGFFDNSWRNIKFIKEP